MIRQKECIHCSDSKVISTGSTLIVYCPYQKGSRTINDTCNLERKQIE